MVDREQGGRADRAKISPHADRGEAHDAAATSATEGDAKEKARRAEFLRALDQVMADHHNVLAALAK